MVSFFNSLKLLGDDPFLVNYIFLNNSVDFLLRFSLSLILNLTQIFKEPFNIENFSINEDFMLISFALKENPNVLIVNLTPLDIRNPVKV